MRIVIVSRGDASHGGSGRIAELHAEGLRQRGYHVDHFVRIAPRNGYKKKCKKLILLKGDILLRNSIGMDFSGMHLLCSKQLWQADLVHFHDFSVAFGSRVARIVSQEKKCVFTFHDFSGPGGGCLYPNNCTRFLNGCGNCPQVGKSPLTLPLDFSKTTYRIHRRIAGRNNTIGISPSQYLLSAAKAGTWREGKIFHIPYPVDTDVFNLELRKKGRARLKLDNDQRAVLFIAQTVDDPRKGFDDALHAFLKLSETYEKLIFVLVGEMKSLPKPLQNEKSRIRSVGKITDTRSMAEIYAGCDCHVLPTKADNFPCSILESLSCGTPVVAYGVGGIPEMISSEVLGKVIAPGNRTMLADGIMATIQNSFGQRKLIAKLTDDTYSLDTYIDKHIALYKSF